MSTALELPATDRAITIPAAEYASHVSGDRFSRTGYAANVSTELFHTPDTTYEQMLGMIPKGYRIGLLEPIAELLRLEEAAKAGGKSVREALKDPLFDRFVRENPYIWERTGAFLRAVKGADNLGAYIDKDTDGRKYVRADFGYGDKVVAEGVRFPLSLGGVVVEINPVLLIPAVVAKEGQSVPEHTIHTWLNVDLQEVGVILDGGGCNDGGDGCLFFGVGWEHSYSGKHAALRVVQGSLDEVPLPSVELFVKDMESYEKGLICGNARGLEDGRKEGLQIGREEVLEALNKLPIAEVLRKYSRQI